MTAPPHAPQAPHPHIMMSPGQAGPEHGIDYVDPYARGSPHSAPIAHHISPAAFAVPPQIPVVPMNLIGKGFPEYRGWTFTPIYQDDRAKVRWAKVHKVGMVNSQSELAAMVKREKDKGGNAQKKLNSNDMVGHKRGQVETLLNECALEEQDPQYEWKLAMIRLDIRKVAARKYETQAMHVIVKRIPAAAPQTTRHGSFTQPLHGEVVDLTPTHVYTTPDPRCFQPQFTPAVQEIHPGSHHSHGGPHAYHHHPHGGVPAEVEVMDEHDMAEHDDPHMYAMPEHGHGGPQMHGHGHGGPQMQAPPNHGHDAHHMPEKGHGPEHGGYRGHEQTQFEKNHGKNNGKSGEDGHGQGGSKQKKAKKAPAIINYAKEKVSNWHDNSDFSDSDSHRSTFSDNETVLLSPPSSASGEHKHERLYEIKPSKHGRRGKDYARQDPEYRQHGRRASSKRSSFNSEDYVMVRNSKGRHFSKYENSRPRHQHSLSDDYDSDKRGALKLEEQAYSAEKDKERRELERENELTHLRQLKREYEAQKERDRVSKERDRELEHAREVARLEGRIEAFQMEEQRNQREQDRPLRGSGRYYEERERPLLGNGRTYDDRYIYGRRGGLYG